MRRSLSLAGAGVALALALTACGTADKPSTAPPSSPAAAPAPSGAGASSGPASATTVTWVNDFCGSLTEMGKLGPDSFPKVAQTAPVAERRKALLETFTTIETAVTPAVEKLGKLGSAPVAAGDEAKKTLLTALAPVADAVKAAHQKLEAAAPSEAAIQEAGAAAAAFLAAAGQIDDPLKGIKASPELEAARKDAPNCKALPE